MYRFEDIIKKIHILTISKALGYRYILALSGQVRKALVRTQCSYNRNLNWFIEDKFLLRTNS